MSPYEPTPPFHSCSISFGRSTLERCVTHRHDQGEHPDRDPEPRHADDVPEPGSEVATETLRRRRLVGARPSQHEQAGGDDERARVDPEDGGRAGRAVDRARDRRTDHEGRLARDADQGIGGAELSRVDEERHDAAEGRLEQAAPESLERDEGDQDPEAQMARGVDGGQPRDDDRPRQIRGHQQRPPRVTVRKDAAHQQRRHDRGSLDEEDDPE